MPKGRTVALPSTPSLPRWLRAELRSDHAGETGAVWLYLGLKQCSRDRAVIEFAESHLETERAHLNLFEQWLDTADKSLLIPLWRLAGWALGAIAALGGPNMVYVTVSAVETFVVAHYGDQIKALERSRLYPEVSELLKRFNADENFHQAEAEGRVVLQENAAMHVWRALITTGSALAVKAARRI